MEKGFDNETGDDREYFRDAQLSGFGLFLRLGSRHGIGEKYCEMRPQSERSGEIIMQEREKGSKYAEAGVNIDQGNRFVDLIKPIVSETFRSGVITDIGGRGPCGGYYADVTRTHICGEDAMPTKEEKKLYKETMDSMNAAIAEAVPGKTTADSAKHLPGYDDDKYKTCSLFQFGHSIGLTLYEGMWISRGFSLDFPAEYKQNMYMAIETYSGKPGLDQAVRLEQNVVITDKGPVLFSLFPFDEKFLD